MTTQELSALLRDTLAVEEDLQDMVLQDLGISEYTGFPEECRIRPADYKIVNSDTLVPENATEGWLSLEELDEARAAFVAKHPGLTDVRLYMDAVNDHNERDYQKAILGEVCFMGQVPKDPEVLAQELRSFEEDRARAAVLVSFRDLAKDLRSKQQKKSTEDKEYAEYLRLQKKFAKK